MAFRTTTKLFGAATVLLVAGILLYIQNNRTEPRVDNSTNKQESQVAPESNVPTYTMQEVAAHGADPNVEECWTVIHGKVYDIIDWIQDHPGGEQISEICGKDGTILFETRPTGSNTPHSAAARDILQKYYIGDLKN